MKAETPSGIRAHVKSGGTAQSAQSEAIANWIFPLTFIEVEYLVNKLKTKVA